MAKTISDPTKITVQQLLDAIRGWEDKNGALAHVVLWSDESGRVVDAGGRTVFDFLEISDFLNKDSQSWQDYVRE